MKMIIIGAGGYGRVVADLAGQMDEFDEINFLDDNNKGPFILGPCETFQNFKEREAVFYPAFGDNRLRTEWIKRLQDAGCRIATIIHKGAYVSKKAVIESGTVIMPKAVVNTGCRIREGCIVNCGAIVDHDCILEKGVHVCLGAIIKAENHLPQCLKIEAGEVIQNRRYWTGE